MTDYTELNESLAAVIEDVPHLVANLANASAVLYEQMEDLNWAGFYLEKEGKLLLGPFQGKVACVEIEWGKGVCGTAAEQDVVQLVPNVHEFAGHIACDSASNSEIVIPIHKNGRVFGVLDIDSPLFSRFDEKDAEGLLAFVKILEEALPLWE